MKRITAFIMAIVMAITLTACGGGDTPPDAEQQKEIKEAKKPVRSELYDEMGTKLADIDYRFNDAGECITMIVSWVDDFGGDDEITSYIYDEEGTLVQKDMSYSYSDYVTSRYYKYNDDGKLIEESMGDGYDIVYEYDANGNPVRQSNRTPDGTMTELMRYECDSEGRVVKEITVYDDWTFVNEYTYDSDGKVLNMDYIINGELMSSYGYTYDGEGNLTKQDVSIESWKMEGYVTHYYE
ncbi:MAG: hypothetical protein IJ410_07545 [Oscillospiraceae bacterium]|nr:hypothetical protein [Oscillospiraceae bacterium]